MLTAIRCQRRFVRLFSTSLRASVHSTQEYIAKLQEKCNDSSLLWMDPKYGDRLKSMMDFRYPSEWFPASAVKRPRTIHFHVGPTNSGKTYAAIQRLKSVERGVYCAPLRLLAMEMWEKLNSQGKRCALRTGEITMGPKDEPETPFDQVGTLACTVEMLDTNTEYDVAVIDEFQMLANSERGWAFTQALLGVNAKEIYLCGEQAAVGLVSKIAAELGDHVTVKTYERLTQLKVMDKSLDGNVKKLKEGDCLVAFSRQTIYEAKHHIEKSLGMKCAVIYGSLPMENRTIQAQLFNERLDGYKVLVASDAIGMGLNLNIQRIVFFTLEKSDGKSVVPVEASQIKQIAGRAGRFGFGNDAGEVTCLFPEDMKYLHECLKTPNEEYQYAGLLPTNGILTEICKDFPDLPLPAILSAVNEIGKYGKHFRSSMTKDQRLIATILENDAKLSLSEKLTLTAAPIKVSNHWILNTFLWFLDNMSERTPCKLDLIHLPSPPQAMAHLSLLESFSKVLDLYLWLGSRFPETFCDRELAMEKREYCSDLVQTLLNKITLTREPRQNILPRNGPTRTGLAEIERVLKDIEAKSK